MRMSTGLCGIVVFLSTLSLRRATVPAGINNGTSGISIHALLAESDILPPFMREYLLDFYPRSPCGERLDGIRANSACPGISIHALLAESDSSWRAKVLSSLVFLSTLSLRRATFSSDLKGNFITFLSTLSLRRATGGDLHYLIPSKDFYPRSPCGERPDNAILGSSTKIFLSTLSLRRATISYLLSVVVWKFLSTLSLRRATGMKKLRMPVPAYFYPRSPCGERLSPDTSSTQCKLFLSTLSLRRATRPQPPKARVLKNFYPRSPCGERPPWLAWLASCLDFYPRSPCGERRVTVLGIQHKVGISIHALLAESDANWFDLWGWAEYFYPRSPCGERPASHTNLPSEIIISIHALLAESDIVMVGLLMFNLYFYPRSPCGERLILLPIFTPPRVISIHALLAESDYDTYAKVLRVNISIHALLAESDQATNSLADAPPQISIHALLAESDWAWTGGLSYDGYFYPRSPCGERRHRHLCC